MEWGDPLGVGQVLHLAEEVAGGEGKRMTIPPDRDIENFDAAARRRRRLDWWHDTGREELENKQKEKDADRNQD